MSELSLSVDQIEALKKARNNELANRANIDKLELAGLPKDELDKLRKASQEAIDRIDKVLSVYGD